MPTGSSQHQILEVARSLFTERGFANVSMRDICREAGVTAPTVYYYFKNKEALWDAVVRETITMTDFTQRLKLESGKAVGPRPDSNFHPNLSVLIPDETNQHGLVPTRLNTVRRGRKENARV